MTKYKRKHYLEDEKVLKHIEKVAGKQKESEWIREATKKRMVKETQKLTATDFRTAIDYLKKNNKPIETPQGFFLFCPKHKEVHLFSPKTSKSCKESLSIN